MVFTVAYNQINGKYLQKKKQQQIKMLTNKKENISQRLFYFLKSQYNKKMDRNIMLLSHYKRESIIIF